MTVALRVPRQRSLVRKRVRLNASRRALLGILGLLIVVAIWELLPRLGIVPERSLPPFTVVAAELFVQLGEPTFWVALSQTVIGWLTGLAVALVLGILIGGILGTVRVARDYLTSTIEFLRPIPSVALIPLVVLLFGSRPQSALVLVVYAAFFQVLIQVIYGLVDVDPVVRDTARSYRFSRWTTIRRVLAPTVMPYLITGFRLAAWVALNLRQRSFITGRTSPLREVYVDLDASTADATRWSGRTAGSSAAGNPTLT